MKRHFIWTAVVAVAIPLALSVSLAHAQDADDQPRLGETKTEYNLRMAKKRGDREALRDSLRESQEKAHRDALRESQERVGAATQRYENASKDFDKTIKDQKARAEREREIRCNRLSQRASTGWEAANRATARYEVECPEPLR
jgi:hypothetical protein